MDFARSFSFITEDKDWFKKVGIAALLILTGIGGIISLGWLIEIVKRVSNDDPEALPGWENIGDYLINGLKLFGVVIVWSLPIIILSICSSLFLFSSSDCINYDCQINPSGVIPMMCISILVIVYSVFLGFLTAPLFGLIGEGLSFKELINPKTSYSLLKSNFFVYLLSIFLGGLISSFLSSIGVIACFVGAFFGNAFGYAVMGHLIGQAHKQARENLGAPLSIEE